MGAVPVPDLRRPGTVAPRVDGNRPMIREGPHRDGPAVNEPRGPLIQLDGSYHDTPAAHRAVPEVVR